MGWLGNMLGSITGGNIIGAGVSLLGGLMNSSSQREANEANLQAARETNETNIQIARENNEFARQHAIDMFNLENAYNDPAEQVKRLTRAGLNPAIMMEGAGGTAVGNSSGTGQVSPSMPSLSVPHVEAVPPVAMGFLDALNSLAMVEKTRSETRHNIAESSKTEKTTDAILNNILSDVAIKAIEKDQREFDLASDKLFKSKERRQRLRNLAADYRLAVAKGETEKADKLYKEAETALANAKEQQVREQAPILLANLRKQGELIDEEKKTEKSKQAANYASASRDSAAASLTRSQKKLLDDQHDDLVRAQKAQADHSEQSLKEAVESMAWRMEKIYNEGMMSKAQWLQVEEALKLAKKENDWYHWNQAFEKIERTNRAVNSWFSITNY